METPPRTEPQSSVNYRADVDGLRAFAILGVAFFHYFPYLLRGGFVGVDIFFVISGYLISGILFKEFDSKKFSFSNFYRRRIIRLFPALSVVLLVTIILGAGILLSDEFESLGLHVAGSVAFIQNLILWRESDYFDAMSEFKPLLHLWSLGVEEQFYILWPATIYLSLKLKWNRSVFLLVFTLLSFVLNIFLAFKSQSTDFYLPFSRFWELFAGAWIFHLESVNSEFLIKKRGSNFFAALGVALIFTAFFIQNLNPYPGFWALLPVTGTVLILSLGRGSKLNRTVFSNKFAIGIGLISYPLYLWHWPLLVMLKSVVAEISQFSVMHTLIKISVLLISVILSYLTYKYLEKPIRFERKLKFPVRKLCLLLGLIFILGLTIWQAKGIPERHPESQAQLKGMEYFWTSQSSNYSKECRIKYPDHHSFCFQNFKNQPPTALLIGDSIANQYFPAMAKYLKEKYDENLLIIGREQVPALLWTTTKKSNETNDEAFLLALTNPNIKTVILSHTLYQMGQFFDNKPDELGKTEITVEAATARTLQALLKARKKVVFILPNPLLDFNHRLCIPRPLSFLPANELCAMSVSRAHYLEDTYRNQVLGVLKKFPEVKVFDPFDYLCDEKYCYAKKDNRILYSFDAVHLSVEGSLWLSQFFNF